VLAGLDSKPRVPTVGASSREKILLRRGVTSLGESSWVRAATGEGEEDDEGAHQRGALEWQSRSFFFEIQGAGYHTQLLKQQATHGTSGPPPQLSAHGQLTRAACVRNHVTPPARISERVNP
jgi:hypothetical protein